MGCQGRLAVPKNSGGFQLIPRDRKPTLVRRMSETPTTITSQKSIATHLPSVLQYASNLYRSAFWCLYALRKGKYCQYSLPFVSQYASHLYCNTPPICIAVLLGKSWWLWSPGCSPPRLLHLKCCTTKIKCWA